MSLRHILMGAILSLDIASGAPVEWPANHDEAKVPPYDLPKLMTAVDGLVPKVLPCRPLCLDVL